MEASILIVSRNRKAELQKTLEILEKYIEKDKHEIRIFLDGSVDNSSELEKQFPWIYWYSSAKSIGASPARNILYKKAIGNILFGFDDDAHPLQPDFIQIAENIFTSNNRLGILAFKEIKGIFKSDADIPEELMQRKEDYLVKDFLGCGFAIKKEVYDKTRGFPTWIDIYGEEVCVAIEILELEYDILYTYGIAVNHRTERQKKNTGGANYFRFGRQLRNVANFYIVYYPFPLLVKKLIRLFYGNFGKYAVKNKKFLAAYLKSVGRVILGISHIMNFRRPVSSITLRKFRSLKNPEY